MSGDISQRKLDHIAISLERDVAMRQTLTGFERYRFAHEALPELRPEDVSLDTHFLGHRLAAPVLLSSMTGGPLLGASINENLARAAQRHGVAMGVGSQRIVFERPDTRASFEVVRRVAPDVLLFANLGAVQFNYGLTLRHAREAVESIGAQGLFLHFNALQEVVQPEGETDFRGLLEHVRAIASELPYPILAKEVGCGIGPATAQRLFAAGVAAVDVSGAGGTSWAKIEAARALDPAQRQLGDVFGEWGIPTVEALTACRALLPGQPLIASGGIRTGLDVAKAIALGADLVGLAMPMLGPATRSAEETEAALAQILRELRTAMFLLGVPDIATLRRSGHLLSRWDLP
ncbi:MAG: type 2 isopentenyl-diphosphate Delta-isomerase [Candidatus Sericytochromatia bacterium]|nr:type 2 isopentenyl-diphosphate Delta-isomerase [Candidatus Sericytochromatia bacterium]